MGAGSAGCVLAGELTKHTEDTQLRVLVLEAGDTSSLISRVPILAPVQQLLDSTWGYKTVPQAFSHYGYNEQVSLT